MTSVSFVVPVFNKAAFLPSVLQAIMAQRGAFEREYIFIDDGSQDDSLAILRDVTSSWRNVRIVAQENHGSAHATNRGIALAEHDYIKFVDADDLLAFDATAVLLSALSSDSSACVAFGDQQIFVPETPPTLSTPLAPVPARVIAEPTRSALRNSMFNPTQFLARTDAAKRCGGCDERIVFSQEYSLTLRLARQGAFLYLPTTLAFIPQDAPGRITDQGKGRQLQRVTMACAHFLRDYPDLAPALQRFALQRAAGRALKWRRRHGGMVSRTRLMGHALASRLPLPLDFAARIEDCARIYSQCPPAGADTTGAAGTQ